MNRKVLLLSVIILLLGNPMFSFAANWELYDDFSSGTIDPQKWHNQSTSVLTVTVENQRARFIHKIGYPNQSAWLRMVQNPENILGIKAAITIESCTGDVRTRIGGHGGVIGANHIYSSIQLQPGQERIFSSSGIEGPSPNYTWFYDLHYGQFQRPLNLISNSYVASMIFSNDGITYEIAGLGKIAYRYTTAVDPATSTWRAIGTRSNNGDGPCTVYVDDVYVLRP